MSRVPPLATAPLPEVLTLPPRTLTGPGAIRQLLPECAAFGARGLLIHGRALREAPGAEALNTRPAGLDVALHAHAAGEPTLDDVDRALAAARAQRADWIAGVGGGSVLDIAKACAGLLRAPLPVERYHDGADLPPSRTPFIAAPTTAGAGSEATVISVLTNPRTGVKKSFRHPSHLARLVILDPLLLATCPPATVAASGMDALTQAVETFFSRHASGFTDALALEALARIYASLPLAVENPGRVEPAAELLQGSYLAGLALSNARLGLVHGLAHPLGARFGQPHGLVCAVCLPLVLAFNQEAVGPKYRRLAELLGGDPAAVASELLRRLGLRSPFAGLPLPDREAVIRETLASGSTQANPRPVSAADVAAILDRLFFDAA